MARRKGSRSFSRASLSTSARRPSFMYAKATQGCGLGARDPGPVHDGARAGVTTPGAVRPGRARDRAGCRPYADRSQSASGARARRYDIRGPVRLEQHARERALDVVVERIAGFDRLCSSCSASATRLSGCSVREAERRVGRDQPRIQVDRSPKRLLRLRPPKLPGVHPSLAACASASIGSRLMASVAAAAHRRVGLLERDSLVRRHRQVRVRQHQPRRTQGATSDRTRSPSRTASSPAEGLYRPAARRAPARARYSSYVSRLVS